MDEDEQRWTIAQELAEIEGRLSVLARARRQRRWRLPVSGTVTALSLSLAPPTGGLSALIAVYAAVEFLEALRADAADDNEYRHLRRRVRQLKTILDGRDP